MNLTATELKDIFRREIDDLPMEDGSTDGCLWSDADIYRYMNSAANVVARHVMSLYKIFTFTVTSGEPMIKLPAERVLKVRRAYLTTGQYRPLNQLNMDDDFVVDDYGLRLVSVSAWETNTGPPSAFVLDYRPGYLRLYPIPSSDNELVMHAHVLPALILAGDIVPFTADEDISLVLLWMKKLAYGKHDADTKDPIQELKFESEFFRRTGEREPEFRRQTRAPGVTRSIW